MNKRRPVLLLLFLIILCVVFSLFTEDNIMWFFEKSDSISFETGSDAIANPLMGFAPGAVDASDKTKSSLVYVDVTFRELEPEEGKFAFDAIESENRLSFWRNAGRHVVFRFVCDIPGDTVHKDIPDWLYEKTKDGLQYDISYGKGYSPDYNNKIFIDYHAKAVKALGDHFGKDAFFSYIELGSLGHWGEWHVLADSGIPAIPSADIREQYVLPYITAFPNARILMRRPFKTAKNHGFGLFNDMAGHAESTAEWISWIQNGGDYDQAKEKGGLTSMVSSWQTAPNGGEFTSTNSMDWMLSVNLAETTKMIADSHTTFLGPMCPESEGVLSSLMQKGSDETLKNMGYRIGITKMDISKPYMSGKSKLDITWTNTGVAPLYWDWPAYIYLLDSNGQVMEKTAIDISLSKLIPQTTMKTSTQITLRLAQASISASSFSTPVSVSGTMKIAIGIEDPMTSAPSVRLVTKADRIGNLSVIYEYSSK